MKYVKFYWEGDDEILAFPEDTDMEEVKRLLDEYRNQDPEGYNIADFIAYLEEKGIEAEVCEPDEAIYF